MYRSHMKPAIDRSLAAIALVLLGPLMLFTAFLIRIFLGSPVLFRQPRLGKDGQVFEILKFRSMTDKRDASGKLLPDAERLPRFGRFLRSSSIDELPALLNVLRGEMSLVGPRPLLVQYRERYSPTQMRRHEAMPGITGWAQVNGRNAISWEEKFSLDVCYVDNVSLFMDLHILFKTVGKVLRRSDISSSTHVTMEEFMGSPS